MKRILLVSHDSGTPGGPVDKLRDYLRSKNYKAYSIRHPLNPASILNSRISFEKQNHDFKIPPAIQYPTEGLLTVIFLKRQKTWRGRIDLAVCFDPLAFADIYLFNRFYKSKKIIYYNLDYSKERFKNTLMDGIYNWLHKFAYRKSDYFFALRDGVIENTDPEGKCSHKTSVVDQTVRLKKHKIKKIPNSLIYAGAIGSSTNFNPLLKALVEIKNERVPFSLDIYGTENDNGRLRKQTADLGLSDRIHLKGSAESQLLTEMIIPGYEIGLSPYMTPRDKNAPDYLFHGSVLSAKVVDYIAAGLPVIATGINPAFDDIDKYRFGFLAQTKSQWKNALKALLTNKKLLAQYRKNARNYAKRFDEDIVFGNAFKELL